MHRPSSALIWNWLRKGRFSPRCVLFASAFLILPGCAVLPSAGPSTGAIANTEGLVPGGGKVALVDVDALVARRLNSLNVTPSFAESMSDAPAFGALIGPGDSVEVTVWEAPPAVLFGAAALGGSADSGAVSANAMTARPNNLPLLSVDSSGFIDVPFAGRVQAAGQTSRAIAETIRARLKGKAHDPQVSVSVARNATSNVTIIGDVANSGRMALTAKGERLLDALASAGGVRQPVDKMTIQVTRGDRVDAMPLETVIKDPRQNVRLQADDVVTLLFQPYSFTVLGAAARNEEVPFEGVGLTLSQALGRMGGLQDQRANPRGVFIFRFEAADVFSRNGEQIPTTDDGKVPVIYRVDMKDPTTLFVAQSFPIKDKDVIYVSNAPLADFSKFLQAVSQVVYPIAVIQTTNIF